MFVATHHLKEPAADLTASRCGRQAAVAMAVARGASLRPVLPDQGPWIAGRFRAGKGVAGKLAPPYWLGRASPIRTSGGCRKEL